VKKSSFLPFLFGALSSLAVVGLYTEFKADPKDPNNDGQPSAKKADTPKSEIALSKPQLKVPNYEKEGPKLLKQEIAGLRKEVTKLQMAKKAVEAEKVVLEQALIAMKLSAEKKETPPPSNASFRFGLKEKSPVFDKADWKQLGVNINELNQITPGLMKSLAAGKQLKPALMTKLQKNNIPLASFAIQAAGEVGGSGPNGSFTHPAVMANLIKSLLETSSDPLTDDQANSIDTLGEAWSREAAGLDQGFDEKTFNLAKIIAEVDAKQRFINGVRGVLTSTQDALLFNPLTTGRAGLDLLSPALIYTQRRPLMAGDRASLKTQGLNGLLGAAGIDKAELTEYSWIGDAWLEASPLARNAMKRGNPDMMFPTIKDIQSAARAQLTAMKQIVGLGRLSEEEEKTLQESQALWMLKLLDNTPATGDGK
jgi:hypothetical protein